MQPQTPPTLATPRLLLRPFRSRDRAERLAIGRDPDFHRLVGGDPARSSLPLTAADADRWYRTVSSQPLHWAIDHGERLIGASALHPLDRGNRRARFSIGIFAAGDRGRGFGTEVTRRLLQFAFSELGLHRVDLRVLEFNLAALRMYERCGFRREGVEREGVLIGGSWYGDVMMSILEHEHAAAPDRP